MTVTVLEGDCLERMKELADNSVDAVVTDPPYGLEFMSVAWDTFATKKGGGRVPNTWKDHGTKQHPRCASEQAHIMRKKGLAFYEFTLEWANEVFRILKPGGYLLSFGGTRTYHRLACAIEDAGFEIRDSLMWCYGSGFPKSLDVSKAIDKALGAEREVVSEGKPVKRMIPGADQDKTGSWIKDNGRVFVPQETAPATDPAKQWQGWGTALKPAYEPIIMARAPLSEKNVAANVLKWGTGGVNVDGCRVETNDNLNGGAYAKSGKERKDEWGNSNGFRRNQGLEYKQPSGRFPANLIQDASPEVIALFPAAPGQLAPISHTAPSAKTSNVYGKMNREGEASVGRHDTGSAARFFKACPPDPELDYPPLYYSAKAPRSERGDSKHPTIKPLSLMRYLVRLVTPPGGTVLDPFAGSGTTGEAAILEGFSAILIEREAEYIADIRARIERAERMMREQTMQPSLFSTEPHFPEDSMS